MKLIFKWEDHLVNNLGSFYNIKLSYFFLSTLNNYRKKVEPEDSLVSIFLNFTNYLKPIYILIENVVNNFYINSI